MHVANQHSEKLLLHLYGPRTLRTHHAICIISYRNFEVIKPHIIITYSGYDGVVVSSPNSPTGGPGLFDLWLRHAFSGLTKTVILSGSANWHQTAVSTEVNEPAPVIISTLSGSQGVGT